MIQQMLAISFLVPLPFLSPAWTSESSQFRWCWSLACSFLSMTLLAWEISAIVWWLAHPLILPFLGTGMRIDFSCLVCWYIECRTLIALAFRILNSSAGISSPALALLTAVLSKAHLTSHSRTSGSGWMTTPLWLSGSLKSSSYGSSVYFFCLCLISSASIRSLLFLSFTVPVFGWNVLLILPIFLKRSLVFALLLFSSVPLHCSLKKAFLSLLVIFWNSAFSWVYPSLSPLLFASLLCSVLYKARSGNHFAFLLSFFFGVDLCTAPMQYYGPLSIVIQVQCLLGLIPWMYSLPPL